MRVKILLSLLFFILFSSCTSNKYSHIIQIIEANNIEDLKIVDWNETNINFTDSRGRTLIYIASLYGHFESVKYLLNNGADPSIGASWKDMATPLHVSASQGYEKIVEYLLDNGVDVNCFTLHGVTPLHMAARHRKHRVVRILLSHNANINAIDSYGKGVLQGYDWTFERGKDLFDTVNLLIREGADVNRLSNESFTPLMEFCIIGSKPVVELLLKNEADASIQNKSGLTALYYAKAYNHDSIVDLLNERVLNSE